MTIYLFTSNKFGILGSTLALLSNKSNENNKQSSWRDVLPTDHPADPWSFSCHEFNVVSKSVDLDHTESSMKECLVLKCTLLLSIRILVRDYLELLLMCISRCCTLT